MLRAIGLLALVTGCFAQATAMGSYARGGVTGGAVEMAVGEPAVRGTGQLSVEQKLTDDGRAAVTVLLDEGLRGSILGAIFQHQHDVPDWTCWLDFGADAGVGAGGYRGGALADAYVGGWADLRLWSQHEEYPTLRVQARRLAYLGGIANSTELFVGVGWTRRHHYSGPFN